MDDKILELVSENPFSILVNDDNYFTNISLIEILKAYNLVYIVQPYQRSNSLLSTSSRKHNPGIRSYIYSDKMTFREGVVYLSMDKMIDILLQNIKDKSKLDISLILIDISYVKPLEIDIIFKLWSEIYYNKDINWIPNLVLLNSNSYFENIPFIIKDNKLEIENKKKDIKIYYTERHFLTSGFDDIEYLKRKIMDKHRSVNINDEDYSIWLVLLANNRKMEMLKNSLSTEGISDLQTVIYDNRNRVLESKAGKRKIVITKLEYIAGAYIEHADGLFDSLQVEKELDFMYNRTYMISQKEADKNLGLLQGKDNFAFRLIPKEGFRDLPQFPSASENKNKLRLFYMKLLRMEILNQKFFNQLLDKNDFKLLDHLNLVKDHRLSKYSEIVEKIPLPLHIASIIYQAHLEKIPLYPVICLATMIAKIHDRESLLFRKEDTPKLKNQYSVNILIFYLNIWLKLTREYKTLDIDRLTINKWSKNHNLNQTIMNRIHSTIKLIYSRLALDFDIVLGYFDSHNLFEKCKPILERVFKNRIYNFKDKERNTYINNQDIVAELKNITYNPVFKYPNKLIAYSVVKSNHQNDECVITYFSPLN